MKEVINIKNISKYFGKFKALDSVNLNVLKGQKVVICGPSGSGKSTLLEKLKAVYKDDPKMVFLDEPVKCWNNIKDANGVTMLEKFYSDQDKYSFPFQLPKPLPTAPPKSTALAYSSV